MFFNGQKLGEPLGKRLCEGLVVFENALDFLSIKFGLVRYQIGISETAVMRFFLFPNLLSKKMAIYEDRKFVVMWAVPPPTNTQKLLVTFLVTWSAKSG